MIFHKLLNVFIVIFLSNCDIFHSINEHDQISTNAKSTKRTIVSLIFSNKSIPYVNPNHPNRALACRWLKGYQKQNKQCQNRRGFARVLQTARTLAVEQCEEQFRYDRWNCSYKKTMFQKVYRETAFMYAITASAVMYSTARACSDGLLQKCSCADYPKSQKKKKNLENGANWNWGGCGDNTKKARKIAKRFLHIGNGVDGPTEILNYNTNIGLNTVRENERKQCFCHGVSGSCIMKTCWKQMKPFPTIAKTLKQKYHAAAMINIGNQSHNSSINLEAPSTRMLYLTQSPTFCEETTGRRCKDYDHCATLCCGRGNEPRTEKLNDRCECRWQEKFLNVTCKTCTIEREYFVCK